MEFILIPNTHTCELLYSKSGQGLNLAYSWYWGKDPDQKENVALQKTFGWRLTYGYNVNAIYISKRAIIFNHISEFHTYKQYQNVGCTKNSLPTILWVRFQAPLSSIQWCFISSWICVWLWDLKEWLLTCTSIVAPSLCNMSEHPRHFCGRWLLGGNSDIWELSASMSIHISWVATTMNWSGFQSKEILSSVNGSLVLLPTKKNFLVIQITILMLFHPAMENMENTENMERWKTQKECCWKNGSPTRTICSSWHP